MVVSMYLLYPSDGGLIGPIMWTYCTIEANDRHEASHGLFVTAELLV